MAAEEHGKPWRIEAGDEQVGDEPFREKTSSGGTGSGKSWPMLGLQDDGYSRDSFYRFKEL